MAEYIEREAALHVLGTMPLDWEYGRGVSDCYDAIKAVPAADVAPVRHARWVFTAEKCYPEPGYKCSACRSANWRSPDVPKSLRYCPHCGAKMDQEKEE